MSPVDDSPAPIRKPFRTTLATTLISWTGYWAIRLVGSTLRWESEGTEHLAAIHGAGRRAIFTFWHGRIFPATWYWRRRGIVVMTSLNRDGDFIAGCIERHGFGAARGSSSRGGLRALGEMARAIREGRDVAFTIDGPRGPRHVAKPGPAILARKTGAAILCFHIALARKVQLRSWDGFQIPIPLTRARMFVAPPIWVEPRSGEDAVREAHQRIQETLDGLVRREEAWNRRDSS